MSVAITYTPSDYPPREDQGAFVFETNLEETKANNDLRLTVIGVTAVALIELRPLYAPCKTNADCRKIDPRLQCSKDALSQQNLCTQAPNASPILKFPLTSKGKATMRTFLIRNVGEEELIIDDIRPSSTSSKDFKIITQGIQFPLKLAPKQEKEITVEYSPSDAVEDKGRVVITSNAGNAFQAFVLLEASSRGCNIEVLPRRLSFRGARSIQVTIANKGNESCVVHHVFLKSGKTEPFSILPAPSKSLTLLPNGSLAFLVKFTPKDRRPHHDLIIIKSSDPDEPVIEVELNAMIVTEPSCELHSTPSTLNYGLIPVGRSRKMVLSLENHGYGTCTVTSINVLGTNPSGNQAFQLTSAVNFPLKIRAGRNIRLDVSYTPPVERPGFEGKLEIKSDDTKQPNFSIKLVGSSGFLCLEVLPPNMDFGATKFGCATPKRTIEVFNLGSSKCIKTIALTGLKLAYNSNNEFRINSAPTVPLRLNIGQSVRLEMSYKAKDLGVDTATLNVENSVAGQSPIAVPLVGEGVPTSEQKDVFKQLNRPLVDIMFVVDDSGSMGQEQTSLAMNFKSFIDWAVRLNVDYQIMVTTTDVEKTGAKAPGCARGVTNIVTPQTPNPSLVFAQNVKVGTSGSFSEKGLEAAYRALISPASTGCNKGFYRKKASLSLIFISDEPDQSPQPVQFYLSFFKSLKGLRNLNLLRASAVVGPPSNGCLGASGNASSAPRYWEVAKQLKGVQASICSTNWSKTLSNLGSLVFGYRAQFFLSRQAEPTSLKVKVNGTMIKENQRNGWFYEASSNSIHFSKSQIPSPGATIQIEYRAICLP